MNNKEIYEGLGQIALPGAKRRGAKKHLAKQVGCHLNTITNYLHRGKPSPLYGAKIEELGAEMVRRYKEAQRAELQKRITRAEEEKRAAMKQFRSLAA